MSKKTGLALSERSESNGFTLIEIMVVVFIIGLLASIITVSVNQSRMRGRDARRRADLDSLRTGIEMYANNSNQYPTCIKPDLSQCTTGWAYPASYLSTPLANYLNPIPHDPIANRRDRCYGGAVPTCGAGPWDYNYIKGTTGYALLLTFDNGTSWCKLGNQIPAAWSSDTTYPYCN